MTRMTKGNYSETFDKGLKLLDLYCGEESAFTLAEISRRLDVNKTSVYRLVNTLCEHGYLQKDPKTKAYYLGIRTIPLAHSFLQKANIVTRIKPYVDEVHKEFDLHIDVGLIQNNSIYLVYRRESKDTLAFLHFTAAGDLYNLATGKAAMAFMAEEQLAQFLQHSESKHGKTRAALNPETLKKELTQTRQRGYSLNEELFLPGLIAIGAPIFNLHTMTVLGGISFDSSTSRYSMAQFEKAYSSVLVELAKKISAAISTEE